MPVVPPNPTRERSTKRSSAGVVRPVLAPIAVDSSNKRGSHRRRNGRLRRGNNSITDSTPRKALVIVRGGREGERSHGLAVARSSTLPVVACVKEGSAAGPNGGEDGKRTKREDQARRSSVSYTLAPFTLRKEKRRDDRKVLPEIGKTGRRRKAQRSKAGIGQHEIGVRTESDTGTDVVSSSPRKLMSNHLRSVPIVEMPIRKNNEKHDNRRNKESLRAKAGAPKRQRIPASRDDYERSVSAEVLTMALWDAAFPAPKPAPGSARNEGLGPTTRDGNFSPDWKSRSSRDSYDHDSRSFASDTSMPASDEDGDVDGSAGAGRGRSICQSTIAQTSRDGLSSGGGDRKDDADAGQEQSSLFIEPQTDITTAMLLLSSAVSSNDLAFGATPGMLSRPPEAKADLY